MGFDNACNTGLVLGLGFSSENTTPAKATDNTRPKMLVNTNYEPNLTLGLISGAPYVKVVDENYKQQSGGGADSGGSSFSNLSVKREREIGSFEEVETTTMDHKLVSSRAVSDEDDDGGNGRKKLRLTKAQSALLEESFKNHSTLNPQKQKQELARELKLRPRQVEVWFQNRRARTKLKQTEVDCEYLKKCCETLTDENRRLQKELQELKALKVAQPLYMQLPAATLTMCPSCERVGAGGSTTDSSSKSPSSCPFGSNKPHFYNPFTNSSAAC